MSTKRKLESSNVLTNSNEYHGLTSITIPDSITCIGVEAFLECTDLESVTIPSSVTTIEDRAFKGCTKLKSIVIPDSVTRIGDKAFEGCVRLTSILSAEAVISVPAGVASSNQDQMSDTLTDIQREALRWYQTSEPHRYVNGVKIIRESDVDTYVISTMAMPPILSCRQVRS